MPEQVKHGLIVRDLRRSDQDVHDDATFASIHHVVSVIPQMSSASLQAHGCGIGIGGTDTKVSSTMVGTMNFSLLSAFLRDPVMAGRILSGEFFSLCIIEDDRQRYWRLACGALRLRFRSRCIPVGSLN